MTTISRRAALVTMAAVAAVAPGMPAIAQTPGWPQQVTLVVPFPPGGSNDIFARLLAQKLGPRLGANFIIDNKPGAGGTIGAAHVSRAAPNGATLLLTSSTFTGSAAVQTKTPYDAVSGFTPVAQLAKGPMIVAVGAASPWKSVADLIKAAKAEKSKFNYGTAGVGSINHLAAELLFTSAGIELTHIPYKGIANALTDLIGGRLDVAVASVPSLGGQLKAEKVRGLAVTSAQASPFAAGLAPVAATVPGYALELWWGVFAPPGMSAALVERLNREILAVTADGEMKERFAGEGAFASTMTAAQFAQAVRTDLEVMRRVAKERKISAD